MKRTTWIAVFGAAMMVLLALLAAGCDNSIGEGGAIDIFYINSHGLKLMPRETRKLTVTANLNSAANKTVTWSSSNPEVATVDGNGRVTATNNSGFSTITAHLGDKEAICPVRVCCHEYPDEGDKCDECGFPKPVLEGGEIDYTTLFGLLFLPVTLKKYDGEAAEVNIPEGVTEIGERAFKDCTNLVSVKIPDGVTKFGNYAFQGCTSLESVTIPDSVTSLGDYAFDGCTKLKEIQFGGTMAQWNESRYRNCPILGIQCSDGYIGLKNAPEYLEISRTVDAITVTGHTDDLPADIVIPEGVTEIYGSAFSRCTSLVSVKIPNSVTTIGTYAFKDCTSLTSVKIPNGVTKIGWNTFEGCTSLASVTIPNSVTVIESQAFEGCTSLASVTIPNSVTVIVASAFKGCTSLESVTIPNSVTEIKSDTFQGCTSLVSVKIPNGVTSIGSSAFYGCRSLVSVKMPASVTSLGNGVFNICTKLKEIQFGGTMSQWNAITGSDKVDIACIQCSDGYIGLKNAPEYLRISRTAAAIIVTEYDDGLPADLVIPDGVTSIRYWAFSGCENLTSVTIPASVTVIGSQAFKGCTNLTTINYAGTEEQWKAITTKNSDWDSGMGDYTITYNYKE